MHKDAGSLKEIFFPRYLPGILLKSIASTFVAEHNQDRLALRWVIIFAVLSFIIQLRCWFGTDITFLAIDWIKDDSYYYLQPAFLFKQYHFFTFDGINRMYGFQPLWMLILTVSSWMTDDKLLFLRLSLTIGSLFYCLTGILLYRFFIRFFRPIPTIFPTVIWLFNADLQYVFVSGKENALTAFLLLGILLIFMRYLETPRSLLFSGLLGLLGSMLILARTNLLMGFCLLIGLMLIRPKHTTIPQRVRNAVFCLVVAACVAAPWLLYAKAEFGTAFPTSGIKKLIGIPAALTYSISKLLPGVSAEQLGRLLPEEEYVLLSDPQKLMIPSVTETIDYVTRILPGYTFGFGLVRRLFVAESGSNLAMGIKIFRWFSLTAGLALAFAAWRHRRTVWSSLKSLATRIVDSPALVLLLAIALLNTLANALLLPLYLSYGIWYAVPEFIVILFLFTWLMSTVMDWIREHFRRPDRLQSSTLIIVGFLAVSLQFIMLSPAQSPKAAGMRHGIWEMSRWLNTTLKKGDRVGSWNAGLLGYYSEGPVVINLDGLANSLEYIDTVIRPRVFYVYGRIPTDPYVEYFQRSSIRFLADAEESHITNEHAAFGIVPVGLYRTLYRDSTAISSGILPQTVNMTVKELIIPSNPPSSIGDTTRQPMQ